jgi:type VII secretion protein EccB
VCVQERETDTGTEPFVTLIAGRAVGDRPLDGNDAMLVDVGGQTWAIWQGARMRVPAGIARGLGAGTPASVPVGWLNALPEGPDLAAPSISGRGRPVTGPGGDKAAVGQVFRANAVAGGEPHWYVLLADGLAPITRTQATLLLSDPAAYSSGTTAEVKIDAAAANAAPQSRTKIPSDGLPASMPKMAAYDPATPLCAVYADADKGSARARLMSGGTLPASRGDTTDLVRLPPGKAIVAGVLPGDGQLNAVQAYYLVTDEGRRYAVPNADVLTKLGYDAKTATPVPANVLQLIPEGPVLDPARAAKPVTATAAQAQQPR